jgi:hypothetical protein
MGGRRKEGRRKTLFEPIRDKTLDIGHLNLNNEIFDQNMTKTIFVQSDTI